MQLDRINAVNVMVEYSGDNRSGKAERERRSDLKNFALFIYGEVRYVASSFGKNVRKNSDALRCLVNYAYILCKLFVLFSVYCYCKVQRWFYTPSPCFTPCVSEKVGVNQKALNGK
jgi:hypothetical protein